MNCRIVAYALNSWYGPWMNRQQILSRLARSSPVVYSNGAWSVWKTRTAAWHEAPWSGRFDSSEGVSVDVAPRWMVQWPRLRRWSRYCVASHSRRLRTFSSSIGEGPLIGYLFHPKLADHIDMLAPDHLVYHEYDLLPRTPGWSRQSADWRRSIVSRADLVIASSQVIRESLLDEGAREVLLLPNGADVDAFEKAAVHPLGEADDIAVIPAPRIGYVGNLNRKVDFPLVAALARRHPEWQFVFVGGLGNLDELTRDGLNECQQLANVHFLGAKDHRQLPSYVASMDVNTMVYRTDSGVWTAGISPLKLHEYLAAGRPVISSPIPSVLEHTDVVAIAETADQWAAQIQAALDGDAVGSVEDRRAVARANSWDIRVDILRRELNRLVDAPRNGEPKNGGSGSI